MVTPAFVVSHSRGEYPVYIGHGLLCQLPELLAPHVATQPTLVITDANVGRELASWLSGNGHAWGERPEPEASPWQNPLVFPAGERSKTRAVWEQLTDELLARDVQRDHVLVALGGGVTGDLAGFVAATYMRGIRFVQVPTSLLAMVDASVGGKVGVDTPVGKNLVGAFHPPAAVIVDLSTLATLPHREFRSGFSEAVKHGLIADRGHLDWIEANVAPLLARKESRLADLVRSSVAIKARVVGDDERESGARTILNVGHTIGHALEQLSQYTLLHGEALAMGLVAECRLGERLGTTAAGTSTRVEKLLSAFGLPTRPTPALLEQVRSGGLEPALRQDKKNRGPDVRVPIVKCPGAMAGSEGRVAESVPISALVSALIDPA